MKKILKKISASFLLILMLFSVAFNVLDYGYKVYAAGVEENSDGTYTITSTYFQLKIQESTYNLMTEDEWRTWLSKYDSYYNTLRSFTGVDPISETGNSYITINALSNNVNSYAYYHTYENGWDCTIFMRKNILDIEINKIKNNISSTDSYTLIHELGHAFQYQYDKQGSYPENWCFNVEIMTMIEAAYVQEMCGISTLYYANLATFTDCKTAYINQMNGNDSGYNNYYWLAGKLLAIKDSSSLNSFKSIINSGKVSGSYSDRFNTFIDTWEKITNEEIWSQFTDNDISKISSTLGGTIGTLNELTVNVTEISIKGNESKEEGKIDFTEEDTQAIVKVVVKSEKQPKSVTIKISDKETTVITPTTIANDTYTYEAKIDLSNETTQEQLIKNNNVYITVIDANNEKTEKSKGIEVQEEQKVEVSISDIVFKQNENSVKNQYDDEKDINSTISFKINGINEENRRDITSINLGLDGFGIIKNTTKYSYDADSITLEVNVQKNEDTILKNETIQGKITVVIQNEEEYVETFNVEIINAEEVEEPYINSLQFKQEGNEEENVFDAELENKNVKLTVTIENIQNIEEKDLENLDIKVNCTGFKKVSTEYKGKEETTATYEITLEYEGLLLDDLIDEKYVECEIKTIVNEKLINKYMQLEIKNVEEEEEAYKFYYGLLNEEDGKIHYEKFPEENEITIEGENEVVLYIMVKGVDIHEKHLVIEGTIYDHEGRYVEEKNWTKYGITFKKSGTYNALLDGEEIAKINVNITTNLETKYVYVFNSNGDGMNNTNIDEEANKAQTDRPNADLVDIQGTEENWIIEDLKEKDLQDELIKYYCYNQDKGIRFYSETKGKYYFYKYKSKEKIELENKDLLVMSFIKLVDEETAKEISGLSTLPPNWRENALQYYIWAEVGEGTGTIGYGLLEEFINKLTTNEDGKNDYIDFDKKTITLDGKVYKIKDYTALKYYVIQKLEVGSNYIEDLEEGDAQPLITFEVEVEDGPGIQLQKVDEEGNPLEATFTVFESKELQENDLAWYKLDEYKTDKETGLTEIISTKEGKYAIFETKAPEGYKPTTQYAIIEVDKEGNCTYTIYEAPEDSIDENGYIKVTKLADGEEYTLGKTHFIGEGTELTEEFDWNYGEVEEDGEVELLLILTNKYDKPSLKIVKVDQNGQPITNKAGQFKFDIIINGKTFSKELNDNGEIELKLVEETIVGKELNITIKETASPDEYEIPEGNEENTFKVAFSEENGWELVESAESEYFDVTVEDSQITAKVTNIKKKDLEFKIYKEDATEGRPMGGITFTISGDLLKGTLTTDNSGNTGIITVKKENLKPGTYDVTIKENNLPAGYKPLEDATFKITISEDGSISVGRSSNTWVEISTETTDDVVSILATVKNYKEEEDEEPEEGAQFPLIMTISGTVWLDELSGKNSEANGTYDGGEELEGIEVEIFEADGVTPAKFADKNEIVELMDNENAQKYLSSDLITEIKNLAAAIPETNKTETNEQGIFTFVGLDPDKLYTIKFTYNGMRYSEIMASIGVEGCGISAGTTTTAKAIENAEERAALTAKYQEITPDSIVFTQTEVEYYENEKLEELGYEIDTAAMEKFIEDTKITAQIDGIGGILSAAENKLVGINSGLSSGKIASNLKFPVVKTKTETVPYDVEEAQIKAWIDEFMSTYLKGGKNVGYKIEGNYMYNVTHKTYSHSEYTHSFESSEEFEEMKTFMYQKLIKTVER